MIKIIALIFKKPDLSDEGFSRYWKEKHGPLAAKVIPGLRKYTQSHLLKLPGLKYEGDGLVELWFDDLEGVKKYLAWRQSDAARPLLDDEDKFIDRSKSVRYAVEEHVIIK
ncbi:MAG: EthD domain-containing protein [Thermodesulfobacteriota bacterium]|jgi:uncharacterized protein (TIGR02118 family)